MMFKNGKKNNHQHQHQKQQNHYHHRFKLVILGDTGVGKTSLAVRFVRDAFRKFEPTTGGTFYTQNLKLEAANEDDDSTSNSNSNSNSNSTTSMIIKFNLWDTSGEDRFRSVAPLYYKGASAAIVVYDVTSYPSFQSAKSWIDELSENRRDSDPELLIALVGNKTDLEPSKRTVTFREADAYAQANGFLHTGTSAKTAENVKALFFDIARELSKPDPLPADEEPQEQEEAPLVSSSSITTTTTSTTTSSSSATTTMGEPLITPQQDDHNNNRTTTRVLRTLTSSLALLLFCFKRNKKQSIRTSSS